MPNVRFVEGTFKDYSIAYDTDWPIVPRVGEYVSISVGSSPALDWKVTRICHVAYIDDRPDGEDKLTGTLAWIEAAS